VPLTIDYEPVWVWPCGTTSGVKPTLTVPSGQVMVRSISPYGSSATLVHPPPARTSRSCNGLVGRIGPKVAARVPRPESSAAATSLLPSGQVLNSLPLAGPPGFEPGLTDPESAGLPLPHGPGCDQRICCPPPWHSARTPDNRAEHRGIGHGGKGSSAHAARRHPLVPSPPQRREQEPPHDQGPTPRPSGGSTTSGTGPSAVERPFD
jgi:hypothetical protein